MKRSLVGVVLAAAACSGSMSPMTFRSATAPTIDPAPAPVIPRVDVYGTVTHSETGRPIEGAMVSATDASTTTDQTGFYVLGNLFPWQTDVVHFSKAGFETADRTRNNANPLDARLQPSLVIAAGDRLQSAVYPNDPQFWDWMGENTCAPCRLIHVRVPPHAASLMIRVLLPSDSPGAGLVVDTDGGSLGISCCALEIRRNIALSTGDVRLGIYTDPAPQSPVPFELVTSIQ